MNRGRKVLLVHRGRKERQVTRVLRDPEARPARPDHRVQQALPA